MKILLTMLMTEMKEGGRKRGENEKEKGREQNRKTEGQKDRR